MKAALLALCSLSLASCVTFQDLPEEFIHQPPAAAVDLPQIYGTTIESRVPFIDDHVTYVFAIDSKWVLAKRKGWDTPVRVAPGRTAVAAGYVHGVHEAVGIIEIDLAAGKSYQATSECNTRGLFGFTRCDFWLIDRETRQVVSQKVRAEIGAPLPKSLRIKDKPGHVYRLPRD